ncbi:MAG TPA: TonB-dependent receptor [Xanthomonadales bacterium]|nr:TonB-dependent receptor [Xanthomonadales bacterium]
MPANLMLASVMHAALANGPALPRVVVVADARAPAASAYAGAETVLDASALARPGAREDAAEALRGIAGLVVRDRRNLAQDLQLSSRGFGARASFGVRGVKLYVNGVPATAADGQGQLSHAVLDHVTRIEVLRGPVAALYGNAAGAVVRIEADPAAAPSRYAARTTASRDGWRASASAAARGERAAALVVASRLEHDGFRPQSSARRDQLDAVAGGRAGGYDWSATFNGLDQPEAQDPLGLTRAAFDANPDSTAPQALAFDTRKSVRQRQAGFAATRGDADAGHAFGVHGGSRAVVQYLSIPPAPQQSPTHAGGVIDLARDYAGIDARAWRRFAPGRYDATATVGVHLERLREQRRGYENFVGDALGRRGALRRDEHNATDASDLYARLDLALSPRWSALAGLRASALEFRSDDRYVREGNPDDSGRRDFSDTGAVLGLAWTPTADARWHLAWGEGFESPTANELAYRSDGSTGINAALEPARNRQLEAGLRIERARFTLSATAFRIDTDDEIATAANTGGRASFRNAGRTRRDGVEAEVDAQLGQRTRLRAALGWLDARFEDGFATPAGMVRAGHRLPGVPQRQAWLELRHEASDRLALGLVAEHVGRVFVDDLNRDAAASATTFDLYATRTWRFGATAVEASLRLANAADRRYAGSVIVNEGNGRYFEPAPGRRVHAAVAVAF